MRPETVTARLRCNNGACLHEWTVEGTVTACPKCTNTQSTILRLDASREVLTGACMRCGSKIHGTRDCPIGTMP